VTSKKPKFLHVEGKPDLVRDTASGAILNTKSTPPGTAAKKRREKDKTIDSMKNELDVLKSEISDIKSLLIKNLEMNK
tara:strand:+ start:2327 stop:2560 length:234 start_codon:yes stop_codon:yes gene_type:complete